MERSLLFCLVLGIYLSISAEPVASSSEASTPQQNSVGGVSSEELRHLADSVKERLRNSYNDLKEQFEEGDALLKERVLGAQAQIRDQLKDGDSRLKEELQEDVEWLDGKIKKIQERMGSDIFPFQFGKSGASNGIGKLKDCAKSRDSQSSPLIDGLKQEMCDLREELTNTKILLQTTRTELTKNRQTLQSLQDTVQSLTTEMEGSTFTRWGRTTCPVNTSLVYTGVAGGTFYDSPGGASNYLCLVLDPQLDNTTAIPGLVGRLYGSEYRHIPRHDLHDVVCSVCRAPQATTIMIPATLTCPAGWTTQYRGQLMTNFYNFKGKTEYVCMDEVRENYPGGQQNKEGALFYYVVTKCGSLPCPPYVDNLVATCVVCSL